LVPTGPTSATLSTVKSAFDFNCNKYGFQCMQELKCLHRKIVQGNIFH
jgi:hypothetical protein